MLFWKDSLIHHIYTVWQSFIFRKIWYILWQKVFKKEKLLFRILYLIKFILNELNVSLITYTLLIPWHDRIKTIQYIISLSFIDFYFFHLLLLLLLKLLGLLSWIFIVNDSDKTLKKLCRIFIFLTFLFIIRLQRCPHSYPFTYKYRTKFYRFAIFTKNLIFNSVNIILQKR